MYLSVLLFIFPSTGFSNTALLSSFEELLEWSLETKGSSNLLNSVNISSTMTKASRWLFDSSNWLTSVNVSATMAGVSRWLF